MRSHARQGGKTAARNVFPGRDRDPSQLVNTNALYEEHPSIYIEDDDEVKLFESTREIRKLITELEEKEAETKTSESKAQ
jgi:hypothetical protein